MGAAAIAADGKPFVLAVPMNTSRLTNYFLAYCIGLIVGYALYIPGRRLPGFPTGGPGDFAAFYTGGRIVLEGNSYHLYDLEMQGRVQQSLLTPYGWQFEGGLLPFNNPPFVALLFAPLAILPLRWAYHVWNLFSVLMILFCVRTFVRGRAASPEFLRSTAIVFSFFPVFEGLWQGQSSFVILFALTLAYLALKAERESVAGFSLCLGLVKPQLILVPVAMFLCLKRWRLLLKFGLGGIGLFAISWMLVGTQGLISYITLMDSMFRWMTLKGMHPSYLPNLRGVVYRLWAAFQFQTGAGSAAVWCSILILAATAAIFVLVLRIWRANWKPRSFEFDLCFAVIVVCGLFLSPYLYGHDLALLVLAGFLVVRYFDHKGTLPAGNWIICLGHVGITLPYLLGLGLELRAQVVAVLLAVLMLILGREAGSNGRTDTAVTT